MKHVGHRPESNVYQLDNDFKLYREDLPDGTTKFWNAKTLKSGCGNVLKNVVVKDGLIFCPYCGEMCNTNQFVEETE